MKFFKLAAVAAALTGMALSATAMTSIQDEELSQVTGQDGVTIAANLNINIGSFQYTNKTQNASVAFNDIGIHGMLLMTVDVLANANAATEIGTAIVAQGGTVADTTIAGAALGTTDVVKFAFPNIGVSHGSTPTITVDSVKLSNSTASFGSFALNKMDLQGTAVYMWAH